MSLLLISVHEKGCEFIHVTLLQYGSGRNETYVDRFVWSENFRYVVDSNLIRWVKYWAIEYPVIVEVR
jgi:hypothetical protein